MNSRARAWLVRKLQAATGRTAYPIVEDHCWIQASGIGSLQRPVLSAQATPVVPVAVAEGCPMSRPSPSPTIASDDGTARRRHPHRARRGRGTAWLVSDGSNDGYLCYWYAGAYGGHLVEQARAVDAPEAVAWGLTRTPRVRIRTADGPAWAGSAPRPEAFTHTWRAR